MTAESEHWINSAAFMTALSGRSLITESDKLSRFTATQNQDCMKVLMLAPHPFYQGRGTPIAADLVLRVLSSRGEQVDLLTFAEGSDRQYGNVTIHRTPEFKPAQLWIQGMRPGFSIKKLVCDAFMLIRAIRMVQRSAQREPYDLVHAGEEAVFIALLIKKLYGVPFVYDMDSSLVGQLTDKYAFLGAIAKPLRACEQFAVRQASAVLAVCQALADEIQPYRPKKIAIVPDISLLDNVESQNAAEPLKAQFKIDGSLLMYVGNLASYQGIDLLLASFAQVVKQRTQASNIPHLVIIGGAEDDIAQYQQQARDLGIESQVHLIGPRPIDQLKHYLAQADIVVSPRTQGANTPMKLYSYLDSGKALLATDLPTHNQVLKGPAVTTPIAAVAPPKTQPFADAMLHLIDSPAERATLGQSAQAYIAKEHTYEAFSRKLNALYDWVEDDLSLSSAPPAIA